MQKIKNQLLCSNSSMTTSNIRKGKKERKKERKLLCAKSNFSQETLNVACLEVREENESCVRVSKKSGFNTTDPKNSIQKTL